LLVRVQPGESEESPATTGLSFRSRERPGGYLVPELIPESAPTVARDGPNGHQVLLRSVVDEDLQVFFEHQLDPLAAAMAAFAVALAGFLRF
jgi:hypothetical protein